MNSLDSRTEDTTPTDPPDREVGALRARILAGLDLQLQAAGDRGHQARLRRLRREGRVVDQVYFEILVHWR